MHLMEVQTTYPEILVECDPRSYQAYVAFVKLLCQISLRSRIEPRMVRLLGFVVATEIDPDEPFAISSRDDLSNFASRKVSSLARNRETQMTHSYDIKRKDCEFG